jgi:hypothetical protein
MTTAANPITPADPTERRRISRALAGAVVSELRRIRKGEGDVVQHLEVDERKPETKSGAGDDNPGAAIVSR